MLDDTTLLAQITEAFPAEPAPPLEVLLNSHCPECEAVSELFRGTPWPEVSLHQLRLAGGITLLTPAGWRYYLPALISWSVKDPAGVDYLQDDAVYGLEPPEPTAQEELHLSFQRRAIGFTAVQRRAIVAYLEWYRGREEAEWGGTEPPQHVCRALDYWNSDDPLRSAERAG
jgi:hypothetical protein